MHPTARPKYFPVLVLAAIFLLLSIPGKLSIALAQAPVPRAADTAWPMYPVSIEIDGEGGHKPTVHRRNLIKESKPIETG